MFTKFTSSRQSPPLAAFTLIETLIAISLMAVVISAVSLSLMSTFQNAQETEDMMIAEGLALDLMNEILNRRYCEFGVSPYDLYLRPGSPELAPGTRELFDDIDDYNGWVEEPPKDRWGVPLGRENGTGGLRPSVALAPDLNGFRRQVTVSYVSQQDLTTSLPFGTPTNFRKIEVTVSRRYANDVIRPLVKMTRIIAYVPTGRF
ncbi:MAG: type IV pilus modification PilV family protein [Thermogutta sp.]